MGFSYSMSLNSHNKSYGTGTILVSPIGKRKSSERLPDSDKGTHLVRLPRRFSSKESAVMQETRVWSLSQEYPLEECMATHSSILAWRIPWTGDPGGGVATVHGGHKESDTTERRSTHARTHLVSVCGRIWTQVACLQSCLPFFPLDHLWFLLNL